MDLRQLKYFVQIAESGNFSRAAEVLRVAQPSLSQQMRNLEDELGVALLARHARGVTPTELGQQLCDHARRILLEVDRAKEALRSRSANPSGRVSVGLPTSACRGLSLSLFQALAERQPNITLHLVEAMTGYLDELIQAGRLDVALLYDHKAFEHVAWTEMMVEDLMLFVPPASALARDAAVPFKSLFRLPLVLPGRPNVLRTVVEQLQRAMRSNFRPRIARQPASHRAPGAARRLLCHHATLRLYRGSGTRRRCRHSHRRSDALLAALRRRVPAHHEHARQRSGRGSHGRCHRRNGREQILARKIDRLERILLMQKQNASPGFVLAHSLQVKPHEQPASLKNTAD